MNIEKISDNKRPSFCPTYFNDPIFDVKVFQMADRLIKDYNGGYWEYATCRWVENNEEHTAAFMYPAGEEVLTLVNPFSGEEIEMMRRLAGMIVTSYAMLLAIEKRAMINQNAIIQLERLNWAIRSILTEEKRLDVWMAMMD